MKKTIIYSLLLTCFSTYLHAQIEAGQLSLGGFVNFRSYSQDIDQGVNTTEESKNLEFGISPFVDYFITDRFSIGIGPGFNYYKNKTTDQQTAASAKHTFEREVITYVSNLRLRHYTELSEKWYFVMHGVAGYSFGNTSIKVESDPATPFPQEPTEYDTQQLHFSLRPGAIFFLNDHLGIEASIGAISYNHLLEEKVSPDTDVPYETKRDQFNFQFSLNNIYLGMQYYF